MSLGTTGQEINAKKMQVFIGANTTGSTYTPGTTEWTLIQNARVSISHPIFREPTTSGGVVTYTGAPDHNISGTLLFTRDEWISSGSASFDFNTLIEITNGEVPNRNWTIKFTDVSGVVTNTTLTFRGCKLSVVDISKSTEGAVKVDISVVCPEEPNTS
jgi:hypothetical protein